MPSDAYPNAVGSRQSYMGQFYPNHIPAYTPQQPSHVYLPPQDDVLSKNVFSCRSCRFIVNLIQFLILYNEQ